MASRLRAAPPAVESDNHAATAVRCENLRCCGRVQRVPGSCAEAASWARSCTIAARCERYAGRRAQAALWLEDAAHFRRDALRGRGGPWMVDRDHFPRSLYVVRHCYTGECLRVPGPPGWYRTSSRMRAQRMAAALNAHLVTGTARVKG